MRERLTGRLLAALAVLGNVIGLRSTESEVTVTVEGRWSGKLDPVRLGLSSLVVGIAVLIGVCSVLSLDNARVEGGPYQIPESVPPGR